MIKFRWYSDAIICLLLLVSTPLQAQQSSAQFEKERKALLQKISSIKKILQQTEAKKEVSIGQLTAINKQIENNHLLIQSLNKELGAITQQLSQQVYQINRLEKELAQLKKEYANMAYLGAKTMHDIHILGFIFSADSFQELLQRLNAIKQYTKLRKKHFQAIQQVRSNLQNQQTTLQQQSIDKNALLRTWRAEQNKLNGLKQQKNQVITALEQQRNKLLKELQQRNKAVKRLDHLITDLVKQETVKLEQQKIAEQKQAEIEHEKQKQAIPTEPMAPQVNKKKGPIPTVTASTDAFTRARGKLPWPVKTGFISNKFGVQAHAVLRNIQVENLGIDIQTQANTQARAIFGGIVKTVAFVPGMNQVVIIQHGSYHSVYAKLKSTLVKVGQYVKSQEPIGVVYTNKKGITELQLQIWKGIQKLNPAGWLAKQPSGSARK